MAEMTLQEAIDHAREVANGLHPNIDGCSECAKQHGQLADWLEELQEFKRVGATPADVRPVVLCKDCDLWNEWDSSGRESLGTYRCSCAAWTTEITTYYTGPDEFCSRGARRD